MNSRIHLIVLLAGLVSLATANAATPAPKLWSAWFSTTGNVTIPEGQVVKLDTDVKLTGLDVEGTLLCAAKDIHLRARWIRVTGTFVCGTQEEPFENKLTVTLAGNGSGNFHGHGDKYIVVEHGGTFMLHGRKRKTWTTLGKTASPGSRQLTLAEPIFEPGDRLVVAPTNYAMEQVDEVTVLRRSGSTVTLKKPLLWEHFCKEERYAGKRLRECAEVGLLTHNIVIQGDSRSKKTRIGGHFMAHQGSRVRIANAEFRYMGQLGRLGRYPIHFHMVGDHARGSYVRGTSIHHVYNRFLTIHATNGLHVEDVVGFDTIGHGFYLEEGAEVENRLVRNLALVVRDADKKHATTPTDVKAAGFWITNPDNDVIGNVAAGIEHVGFWLAFPERPLGSSSNKAVWPTRTPLANFSDNTAHSIGFAGLYLDGGEDARRQSVTTWYEPRRVPSDPSSPHVLPELKGFTAWKSRHYGIWLRTKSGVNVTDARLADNWRSIYLANIPTKPEFDNIGVVSNSLIVGASSNRGTPVSWGAVDEHRHTLPKPWEREATLGGINFYDGPMHVEGTVFANFVPNKTRDAAALMVLEPNIYSISVLNAVRSLVFENARRVSLPTKSDGRMGDGGVMFTDVDGSVTGSPGVSVVAGSTALDDSSCSERPEWNARVCRKDYARVYVTRTDGGNAGVDVVRADDGRRFSLSPDDMNKSGIALNLQALARHELRFRAGRPASYSFWTPEFSGQDLIRLSVPAPSKKWGVTIWGLADARRDSLRELESARAGWFYDPRRQLIHLQFTSQHRGGEIN